MSIYVNTVFISIVTFFLTSAIITAPIVLYQYRKNGFFQFKKALNIYTFVFYLQTVIFLVILPLPPLPQKLDPNYNIWKHINFIPFLFVTDIIKEAQPLSIRSIISSNNFYTTVFNIFMLIPLGVYLRGMMHFSLKKTILLGFMLSLFCEVTQVTGIYFLYKQPYRYFDVNDLITNTLGTVIGYHFSPILSFLFVNPTQEKLKRLEISQEKVKIFPQYLIIGLDVFIYNFLSGLFASIIGLTFTFAMESKLFQIENSKFFMEILPLSINVVLFIALFILLPYFSPINQTLGMKILKYSATVDGDKRLVPLRLIILYLFFAYYPLGLALTLYYIILMLLRKYTTVMDRSFRFEYKKML